MPQFTAVLILFAIAAGDPPQPSEKLDPLFWVTVENAKTAIAPADREVVLQKLVAIEACGGHSKQALLAAAHIQDATIRSAALEAIATALAQDGDSAAAIEMAEKTIEPDRVLYRTAMIQDRRDDHNGAMETVGRIGDQRIRIRAFVNLAQRRLMAEKTEEARTLFEHAAEEAKRENTPATASVAIAQIRIDAVAASKISIRRLLKNDETDALGVITAVALALTDAGRLTEAQKLARAITDEDSRSEALHKISMQRLDTQNETLALDLVREARERDADGRWADQLLMEYIRRLARAQAFDKAKDLVRQVGSKLQQVRIFLEIARFQKEAIGPAPALRTMQRCSQLLPTVSDDTWPLMSSRAVLFAQLAEFQAQCGDRPAAQQNINVAQSLTTVLEATRPAFPVTGFKGHWEAIVSAQLELPDQVAARETLESAWAIFAPPKNAKSAAADVSGSLAPIAAKFVQAGAVERAIAVARTQASLPAVHETRLELIAEAHAGRHDLQVVLKWAERDVPAQMRSAVLIGALRGALTRAGVDDLPLRILVDPWAE